MQKVPMEHVYIGLDKYFITLKELLYKENSQSVNSAIRRTVLMLIMELCDRVSNSQKVQLAASDTKSSTFSNFNRIQKAISYMDAHFNETIRIDDLVAVTNLSRSLFSAEFKNYTGMSAIDYLTIRRIENAMYLLKNTSMSILAISEECGFTNLSNFNRMFKKITTITPKEYKNR